MAMQYNDAIRNAFNDAITSQAGSSARVKMYSGTKPAAVATALSGNTLLSDHPCSVTFAPASSSGVLTLNAISNATAAADGTGSFFRITTSGGTAIAQGTLGTSGADINLPTLTFSTGLTVSVSSFTHTAPGA